MRPPAPGERVVVVGAGPAGLTAARELTKAGLRPIVIEKRARVGGLARTETFKGFRFDMGGHRFFTKVVPERYDSAPWTRTVTGATLASTFERCG